MPAETSMYFLAHSPLHKEKPYRLKCVPSASLSETNIHVEEHKISIHDVPQHDQALDLQKDGFALIPMTSAMTYEDFEDEEKIKEIYLKELAPKAWKLHWMLRGSEYLNTW